MEMMIGFVIAAVVVNVLTYAGIAVVYFGDKHRVDPAAAPSRSAALERSPFADPELDRAA